MKTNKKNGISLLILVITIVVIVILAGAIILIVIEDSPILKTNKTSFINDIKNFQTELEVYINIQRTQKHGKYNSNLLQADKDSVTYKGERDYTITINDIIPALGKAIKYNEQFEVVDGKLVYIGTDPDRIAWIDEVDVEYIIIGEPKVTFSPPTETTVTSGTNIVYTVNFKSNVAIEIINLTDNVKVLDSAQVELTTQPNILIGEVSGTITDIERQVVITITTDNLTDGGYKLKNKSWSSNKCKRHKFKRCYISNRI